MFSFIENWPVYLAAIALLVGFVFLVKGADFFVEGSSSVAKKFNVPSIIIGLTIVAMGTSLPEAAVSIAASIAGENSLAISNAIGSNIFNITWILGLSAQVMPLNSSGITVVDYCVMIFAAILPLLFGFNGKINRIAGIGMFLCFVAYTWYLLSTQNI